MTVNYSCLLPFIQFSSAADREDGGVERPSYSTCTNTVIQYEGGKLNYNTHNAGLGHAMVVQVQTQTVTTIHCEFLPS